MTSTTPRVYVASLADYNAGRHHGAWIDADQDEGAILDEIAELLSTSPEGHEYQPTPVRWLVGVGPTRPEGCGVRVGAGALFGVPTPCELPERHPVHEYPVEEWEIHDFEGFGDLTITGFESIERVAALGQAIAEHGAAFASYASNVGEDYATPEEFEDAYQGEWDSREAFAEYMADETIEGLREGGTLASYFDYEAFARDLFMDGYSDEPAPGGGVYVFAHV